MFEVPRSPNEPFSSTGHVISAAGIRGEVRGRTREEVMVVMVAVEISERWVGGK